MGLEREIRSLKNEARYLELAHQWPAHLRRALELNYAAVISIARDTKYLLWMAALDVLVSKKLGKPKSLARPKLKTKYRLFKARIRRYLAKWGFDQSEIERLVRQLLQTHTESVAARIHRYLTSIGHSDVTIEQVQEWWSVRGLLAHGQAVPQDRLKHSIDDLISAVRAALDAELRELGR